MRWRGALATTVGAAFLLAASTVAGQEGRRLYLEHGASCHGVQLEGQPNWMERNELGRLPAPPHDETGHTWHHSDRQLLVITRDGLEALVPGYETDMPAFGETLSDTEILLILEHIQRHWPERERAYQRARSEADPLE